MNTFELISYYGSSPVTVALSSVFGTMSAYLVFTLIIRQREKTRRLEEELMFSNHRTKEEIEQILEIIDHEEEIRKRERSRVGEKVFDELIERQMKSIESKGVSETRASNLQKTISAIDSKLKYAKDSSDSISNSIPVMRNKLVAEVPSIVEDLSKSEKISEQNALIVNRLENSTNNLNHNLQTTKGRLSAINSAFGGGN